MPINKGSDEPQRIENAYSYSRISSGPQAKGAGIKRQDEKAGQICKEEGWKLAPKGLIDSGLSAYSGKNLLHGALAHFIKAAKDGKLLPHAVLIIEAFDRFSRLDIDESEPILIDLIKLGVAVHNAFLRKTYTKASMKQPLDRIEIMLGFKQAWEYSNNLSKRIRDARQRYYLRAGENKAVRFGSQQPSWVDFIEDGKAPSFKLNRLAELVRGIALDYLGGKKSMMQIAVELNSGKVPCIRGGKTWSAGQIYTLLSSENLMGTLKVAGHTFDHYYPPLITDEQWSKIQRMRSDKRLRAGRRPTESINNLFRGRLTCSECGGTLTTHLHLRKGKNRYYKCHDARLGKCKSRNFLLCEAIELDFFGKYLKESPEAALATRDDTHRERISKIKNRLDSLDAKILAASETIFSMTVDVPVLKKRLEEAQVDRNKTADELANAEKARTLDEQGPSAFMEIKEALGMLSTNFAGPKAQANVAGAEARLAAQLRDDKTREKLLALIPSMIQGLTIDLPKKRYSVETLTGEKSEWRDVSYYAAASQPDLAKKASKSSLLK